MPIQNFFEFVLYITPGFIAIYTYRLKYPVKEKDSFTEISCCVLCGIVIIAAIKWIDKNWLDYFLHSESTGIPGGRLTLAIVVSGVIGGLLGIVQVEIRNYLAKKVKLLRFLSKSTDTIWEFINAKTQKDWFLIFLNDGAIYSGWISKYCYDPNNQSQDFLLSDANRVEENLKTVYIVDGLGVYLNTKDVKRIELIKGKNRN